MRQGAEGRTYPFYRSPDGTLLRSSVELEHYLEEHPCELPGDHKIKIGSVIEADMNDEITGRREWLRGRVLNKNSTSFSVIFEVDNSCEEGTWIEEYGIKDLGNEWRWPLLCKRDFEESAASARAACNEVSTRVISTLARSAQCHPPPSPIDCASLCDKTRVGGRVKHGLTL